MPTAQELLARVQSDFAAAAGKLVEIRWIEGQSPHGGWVFLPLDPPVVARVLPTPITDLAKWNEDWIDPHWNVEPVQKREEIEELKKFWVFGPSYNLNGDIADGADVPRILTDAEATEVLRIEKEARDLDVLSAA